jgi:hypothetical protein
LHIASAKGTNLGLPKSVTYVPDVEIWIDPKFVEYADEITNFGRF